MTRLRLLLLLPALAALACSTVELSQREQMQVQMHYRNAALELAQSMYVAPFYRDASRRLLLRVQPEEDVMLVTPSGQPMLPGAVQGILPAGTRVTVLRVTFPNTWEYATRPLLTPRDRPWVEMAVGSQATPSYVLVLPPGLRDENKVFDTITDYLTIGPIDQEVKGLPAADQALIATKELSAGVSLRGLELAFGPPNLRRIHEEGNTRIEDWTWRSETMTRSAHAVDGTVTSVSVDKLPAVATSATAH